MNGFREKKILKMNFSEEDLGGGCFFFFLKRDFEDGYS